LDYCKFYRFVPKSTFPEKASAFLLPPSGANLLSLLLQNRELVAEVAAPFLSRGLRLGLRPQEDKIEVLKDFENIIVSHPYHLSSDTFQRLVFYMAALRTNSNSVLVFEEPEAHAFPYYTKYLAESIALDERGNQYFVSTHNPYFLLPVLEKTLADDIAIFITYYEDYRTKIMQLPPEDLERIFDEIDVFSNIETFLEER
jgi:predicted ATPase